MAMKVVPGLLCLIFAFCLLAVSQAAPVKPDVNVFDRTCNYTAKNIPAKLFFNGSSPSSFFSRLFPLETRADPIWEYEGESWKACFGPSEPFDLELIKNEKKLPCHYMKNPDGTINYWEEHACDVLLKSNCYSFAVNRYVGSFGEPGYGGMPEDEQARLEITCEDQVKGLVADGAVKVDRKTVYSVPPKGHYIAMAIWPEEDFHMWRLDADGAWANKPGMLMSRRTYTNGTKVSDIEHPDARGSYTDFCGYFEVFPETHKLKGNGYWHSDVPKRFEDWKEMGIQRAPPRPLPNVSQAWRYAYPRYWKLFSTDRPLGTSRVAINKASMSSRPRDK
jgi:hypothetical protein